MGISKQVNFIETLKYYFIINQLKELLFRVYIFGGYGPPLSGYLCNGAQFDEDISFDVRFFSIYSICALMLYPIFNVRHVRYVTTFYRHVLKLIITNLMITVKKNNELNFIFITIKFILKTLAINSYRLTLM